MQPIATLVLLSINEKFLAYNPGMGIAHFDGGNFSGLCSERKQLDVVAGQESWEKEGKIIAVDGYTWFGKPRSNQKSQRGEGGVGFLVCEYLVNEVEFITNARYEESV